MDPEDHYLDFCKHDLVQRYAVTALVAKCCDF